MAGGASYADYERAFRKTQGTEAGVIPAKALESAPKVAIKGPSAAAAPLVSASERVKKKRRTQDALWKANKYHFINCDCGARLKVPPTYKASILKCPRCGKRHNVPRRRGR